MSEIFKASTLEGKPGKKIATGRYNGVAHEIFADDKNLYIRKEGREYLSATLKAVAGAIASGDPISVNPDNNKPRKAAEYGEFSDVGGGLSINGNACGFASGKFVCEPDELVAAALA